MRLYFFKLVTFVTFLLISINSFAITPYMCNTNGWTFSSSSTCNAICTNECKAVEAIYPSASCPSGYSNFVYIQDNRKTYAVSTTLGFWSDFNNHGVINTDSINKVAGILAGSNDLWIGVVDMAQTDTYNNVMPERFSYVDGSALTYSNWASGQPDNLLKASDFENMVIYGEHWGIISGNGQWYDTGYHYDYTPSHKAFIQFEGSVDCLKYNIEQDTDETIASVVDNLCGGETPCLICGGSDVSDIKQCLIGTEYSGESEYLCPNDRVECNQDYSPAICSDNGSLNGDQDVCQLPPEIECSTGYIYREDLDKCVQEVECGIGILNPNTDLCQYIVSDQCPENYTWSDEHNSCIQQIVCPGTGFYSIENDQCEDNLIYTCSNTEYTYNSTSGMCEKPPVCENGTYQNDTNKCLVDPVDTCDDGFEWDELLGTCVATPFCIENGLLNGVTDRCQLVPEQDCPEQYVFNEVSGLCQKEPTCAFGEYNIDRNRCEIAADGSCGSGDYDETNQVCYMSATCTAPGAELNIGTDVCEIDNTFSCPSGYSWSSTDSRCVKNPVCGNPHSYSNSYNTCIGSATCSDSGILNGSTDKCQLVPDQDCPNGYSYINGSCQRDPYCAIGTYNSTRNRCELPAEEECGIGDYDSVNDVCYILSTCSVSGAVLNTSTNKCEVSNTYTCPDLYTWSPTLQKCAKYPSCPSGFTYSTSANKCLMSATFSCPSGYTNVGDSVCQKDPTCPSGTSYNSTLNRCVKPRDYSCSLDNSIYSTVGECSDSCRESASCTTSSNCSVSNLGKTAYYGDEHLRIDSITYSGCPATSISFSGQYGSDTYSSRDISGNLSLSGTWIVLYNYNQGDHHYRVWGQAKKSGNSYYITVKKLIEVWNPNYTSMGTGVTSKAYFTQYSAGETCPLGSYTCNNGQCEKPGNCSQTSCPSGYTVSGNNCLINASCSSGGTLNTSTDKCQINITASCTSGIYDSVLKKCVSSPVCQNGGSFSAANDRCISNGSIDCPTGSTWNGSICQSNPNCNNGLYDPSTNHCEYDVAYSCSVGSVDQSTGYCYVGPSCMNPGALNTSVDKCLAQLVNECPSSYSLVGNVCQKNPTCSRGIYSSAINLCTSSPQCTYGTFTASMDKCTADGNIVCADGTNYNGSTCIQDPNCENGNYDEVNNRCQYDISYSCANGVVDELTGICYEPASCLHPGLLNTEEDRCLAQLVNTCPDTYNLINGVCTRMPVCNDGVYSPALDMCTTETPFVCPTGMSLVDGKCLGDAICIGGVLNINTDRCETDAEQSCPENYSQSDGKCVSEVQCGLGSVYDTELDLCKVHAADICESPYLYNESTKLCELPASGLCNYPASAEYSEIANVCVDDADYLCDEPYQYSAINRQCEVYPMCSNSLYNEVTNSCASEGSCPLGNEFSCVDTEGNGEYFCSNKTCMDASDSSGAEIDNSTEGEYDPQDDGEYDDEGNCLGTIYIFGGTDRRCRPSGLQTVFTDCCVKYDDPEVDVDEILTLGISSVVELPDFLQWSETFQICKPTEKILSALRSWGTLDGLCHYVDSYCHEKWAIVGCVQRKKTYCCFDSPLARIVQEQGRVQLGIPWGDGKHPVCRGFTPIEFQSIDMSAIDFSEWIDLMMDDITTEMQSTLESNIQNMTTSFQDSMQ